MHNRHTWTGDLDACRSALRAGSKTFYTASLMLPPGVRASATALYAFCRLADDTVDAAPETAGKKDVDALERRLDMIYDGNPAPCPPDRMLADIVRETAMPRALLDALLEGLTWDLDKRNYETLDDLNEYAARVAGTVGAMTCLLMDRRDPNVLARACDLGVAMQLTNIARDVGEDARMGRLYLPRQWMRDAGLDPDVWLERPVFNDALASVVGRLLDAADELYRRADFCIPRLPFACRPAIHAARYFYAEIGREISRAGMDSVNARAVVSDGRKMLLVMRTLSAMSLSGRWISPPPLEAARFLVEAAAWPPGMRANPVSATPPWWDFAARIERTIELFIRLKVADSQNAAEELSSRIVR